MQFAVEKVVGDEDEEEEEEVVVFKKKLPLLVVPTAPKCANGRMQFGTLLSTPVQEVHMNISW